MIINIQINLDEQENCFLTAKNFNLETRDDRSSLIKYYKKLKEICSKENHHGFINTNDFSFYSISLKSDTLTDSQIKRLEEELIKEANNLYLLEPQYQ